jgi:hypothetical protein
MLGVWQAENLLVSQEGLRVVSYFSITVNKKKSVFQTLQINQFHIQKAIKKILPSMHLTYILEYESCITSFSGNFLLFQGYITNFKCYISLWKYEGGT